MKEITQYLTVIKECRIQGKTRSYLGYECKCICGNIKIVRQIDFNRNFIVSCGCLTKKLISKSLCKEIPKDTKFGMLSIISKTDIKSTEGYKYLCQCECGNTVEVYANRLKRGETKSCGCSSIKLNSLNNGGTGVPRENLSLQTAIRTCDKYKKFIAECLKRANGKSELSGTSKEVLHVHHLNSVSYIINRDNLTKDSYIFCSELFDINNAIVLTETEHNLFHKEYGKTTTKIDWNTYSKNELIVVR